MSALAPNRDIIRQFVERAVDYRMCISDYIKNLLSFNRWAHMGLFGCINPFKLWQQVKMSSLGPTKFLSGIADALEWAHCYCHQLNILRFCQKPWICQSFIERCFQ